MQHVINLIFICISFKMLLILQHFFLSNEYMRSRQQELESLSEQQSDLEMRLWEQHRDQEEKMCSKI